MRRILLSLLLLPILFIGCAEFSQVIENQQTGSPLTQQDVINGLKEALKVGINIAAGELSRQDGYYGNEMLRILLPEEARTITENLHRIPGGEALLNEVILRINRSAENAAREVIPVFTDAISALSIPDAFEILRGNNDAATRYLRDKTHERLFSLYQPKIKDSLDKRLVGNLSTNDSWEKLSTQWNRIAGSIAGQIAGFEKVDIELDKYLTGRALEGLFSKLAEEEAKIRNNPRARVSELLQRVFGSREAGRRGM